MCLRSRRGASRSGYSLWKSLWHARREEPARFRARHGKSTLRWAGRTDAGLQDSPIRFENVVCRLGGREVLSSLTLNAARGETLVLLGRSGSGKTTALKLINALRRPDQGAVVVQGRSTTDWDPIALRRSIGYVIQEIGLLPHLTVAENVALVPRISGAPVAEGKVAELLERVGLPAGEVAQRRPAELSGGQRQRVGVARALAADPPILLMDEPFGALDPITRGELQRELGALQKQLHKTIVFVTHDIAEAVLLGDRIALLSSGRVAWSGAAKDFAETEEPAVRAFREGRA
ncbi:MAG: ATP-binding cassette domain-containing protein [Acidobacteria bacterium]|nr:ATP-binding cassette domain-containing protein [Acidobacteriota bacterium]